MAPITRATPKHDRQTAFLMCVATMCRLSVPARQAEPEVYPPGTVKNLKGPGGIRAKVDVSGQVNPAHLPAGKFGSDSRHFWVHGKFAKTPDGRSLSKVFADMVADGLVSDATTEQDAEGRQITVPSPVEVSKECQAAESIAYNPRTGMLAITAWLPEQEKAKAVKVATVPVKALTAEHGSLTL